MENYIISNAQKEEFIDNGFLLLPNAVPDDLLSQWQDLLLELNDKLLDEYNKLGLPQNVHIIQEPEKPLLARVNDLLAHCPDAVLDLMACPAMMAIAQTFCGANAIPLQCDVLLKHKHPKSTILWHQDALHSRKFPYINIGIYLDDAHSDDGCIQYVAKTQHEVQNICELVKENGGNIPGSISRPAKAGDILIQDSMILHRSPMKSKHGVRRTIYVEMRPAPSVIEQGLQSKEWTELRKRWMGLILRRSNTEWSKELQAGIPKDLKTDAQEIEQILKHREPPVPAHYCFENITMPNSPM